MNKNKSPQLKFKYAKGIGDALASILHSKPVGWLTHLITGKSIPCVTCTARAEALNILFPIPFWRLFFKTKEDVIRSVTEELKGVGYNVNISPSKNGFNANKLEITDVVPQTNDKITPNYTEDTSDLSNYRILSNGRNNVGDLAIIVQVYQKK